MLRHVLVLLVLLAALLLPTTVPLAHADSATFDPGPPKGVVGNDGIACTGRATQDGHTLTYTVYIGADREEMASNPTRERTWQDDYCAWALAQDMSGWFMVQHGITLDTTNIHITTKRL
jgi:hypothetical protein